jgi:hypothetical protein
LSYIFNNFKDGRVFSEVVAEAKEAGYTEPDPRDDLSGTDVARKVQCAILTYLPHFFLTVLVELSQMCGSLLCIRKTLNLKFMYKLDLHV